MKRLITLLLLLLSCAATAGTVPHAVNGKTLPSLAPILAKTLPGVVNIVCQGEVPINENPFAKQHRHSPPHQAGKEPHKFTSAGSGVIIDAKKGFIVTNAHVVHDAKLITVTLNDGRRFIAKLIGSDTGSDIAVLEIQAKRLHALPMGNSSDLRVGDFVIAIGNPYGLSQTATSGIVSALQRSNLGIEGFENFIQTDAAINSGNSGGALVNYHGQLVGINTAIITPDGGNVGIGFSIPINMAHSVTTQLIKYGHIRRGMLGVMVQSLTPSLAEAFHMPRTKGALVTDVTPNSPAAKAGLETGDIITRIADQTIDSSAAVKNAIGLMRIGDYLKITVQHGDHTKTVGLRIADPTDITKKIEAHNHLFSGMDLRDFKSQISGHGLVEGVQIIHIDENSPAWHTQPHLFPGDVIVTVNRKPVHNLQALDDIARHHDKQLLLRILRETGTFYLVLE